MQIVRTAMWLIGWTIAAASGLVTILVAFGWLPSAGNLQQTYAPGTASIYDLSKTEKAAVRSPPPSMQLQSPPPEHRKAGLYLSTGPQTTYAPSFDCRTDTRWTEQTICHDETLSRYDRELDALYKGRRAELSGADREQLRAEEVAWLHERSACQSDPDGYGCIKRALEQRIAALGGTAQ